MYNIRNVVFNVKPMEFIVKRIDTGYASPYEFLASKFDLILKVYNLYGKIDPSIYDSNSDESDLHPILNQLIGGFQPIASMVTDFQDTFRPYQTKKDIVMDLIQPVCGVGNILKGITSIILIPFLFIGNTIRYAFISKSLSEFGKFMLINLTRSTSWVIDGLLSILRGALQIASSPLTWLIRMPLRGIITATNGWMDLSETEVVDRLVNQCIRTIYKYEVEKDNNHTIKILKAILTRLSEELSKAKDNGTSFKIIDESTKGRETSIRNLRYDINKIANGYFFAPNDIHRIMRILRNFENKSNKSKLDKLEDFLNKPVDTLIQSQINTVPELNGGSPHEEKVTGADLPETSPSYGN